MAEGEGTKPTEYLKQGLIKGKAKQPTQGCDVSVSSGSSSLRKSLLPIQKLTPGSSSLHKSPLPILELAPGSSSSLRKFPSPIAELASRSSSLGKSLLPIAQLAPGQTVINWEIQGLVVHKSEIKAYTKRDSCGIYFYFDMRDKAGGEIRVICFQSDVNRFFEKVVEGKQHVLARGKLIKPKEKFNHTNRRCEIVLEYDSEIRVLEEGHEENNKKSLLERVSSEILLLEEGDENNNNNNNSLLERVTEVVKTLEFCTSKLLELETEIKRKGKIGNPGGTSTVRTKAPDVGGVSDRRAQAEKKTKSPGIRKTSSSNNITRGPGLGTLGATKLK